MEVVTKSRFEWAIAEMNIRPGDTVLEIGPGTGIALEIITKLVTGSVVAMDKSQAMLLKAETRLKKSGLEKRVAFILGDAQSADFSRFRFDKVFAFNVGVFYSGADLKGVLDHIVNGGIVGIFYQNPPGSDRQRLTRMLDKTRVRLDDHGFTILKLPEYNHAGNTPTSGVIAVKR